MIENDAAILQHFIENWEREIPDYLSKLEDKVVSRQILPVRKVGADVMIDEVVTYNRTGEGAQIMAKGAVPKGSGLEASHTPHKIYQLLDGFLIHEKDLKLDPKLKSRDVEIVLKNLIRAENIVSIQGDTAHNIPGVTTEVPGANQLKCKGKWDGSATAPTIYNDVLKMYQAMDPDRDPRWLLGNKSTVSWLYTLSDDTKQPIWKQVAAIFGKTENDPPDSWLVQVGDLTLTAGKVYMLPHDMDAGELVISENSTMRPLPQQRGGNYPIEMYEWLTVEIHKPDAYVELDTTVEA
jgi:hypothetical protein